MGASEARGASGWLKIRLPRLLPSLEGRRGSVVLAVYVAAALVVAVVIGGSFWFNARDFFHNMPTAASYGFRTITQDEEVRIAGPSSAEARASGLRRGDHILSIDGETGWRTADEYRIGDRLAGDTDGRIALETRSQDGTVRLHHLTRRPVTADIREPITNLPFWPYIVMGFAATQAPLLLCFAASVVLALRRPRDPEAMLFAYAFLLMCVTIGSGFWLTAFAGFPSTSLDRIGNIGECLLIAAIAGFPDGRYPSLLSRLTLILAGVIAVMLAMGVGSLALLRGLFIVANAAVITALWLRFRYESSGIQRQQIKWAVLGFAGAILLILPVQFLVWIEALRPQTQAHYIADRGIVTIGLLLIPTGLLISLLRYRLYDAEAAISRSAAIAALTLVLGATYAAASTLMEAYFQTRFGRGLGILPGAIGAALAVMLLAPMNNRIQAFAERRFRSALVHLRRDLPDCVGDLRETAQLDELLAEALERVSRGVRASRAAAVIDGKVAAVLGVAEEEVGAWLQAAALPAASSAIDTCREDRAFPMRIPLQVRHGSEGAIGWLLLGPRPDGSFYGRDERETLAEISDPVARSVAVVLRRERREGELRSAFGEISERLAALEHHLLAPAKPVQAG